MVAAVKLASFCSGLKESVVEASYRRYCSQGGFQELHCEEDTDDIDPDIAEEEKENEAEKLIECLQRETVFIDPEIADENNVPTEDVEVAFEKVTEKEVLEKLLKSAESAESAGTSSEKGHDRLPRTLLEAVSGKGDMFNALWRLAVFLRCGQAGVDAQWINDHRSVRQASLKLNWHQKLGSKDCLLEVVSFSCGEGFLPK